MRVARLALAAMPLLSAACATELVSPDRAPVGGPPVLGPPPAGSNGPPTLTISSPGDGTVVPVGSVVTVSADFVDPDPSDLHTCTVDWEIALTAGTVTESGGAGTCTAGISFGSEGTYVVTMSLIDSFGNTAVESISVTAQDQAAPEPEPMTGLVIAEGKLHLPRGAYRSAPRARGPMHFVALVRPATESGRQRTRFRAVLHEPRVWFDARRFDDVTLTPGHAVISGIGSLKGRGTYQFTLWLVDGNQPGGDGIDRVRLRVWNEHGMILDTEPGARSDADPVTPIDRGLIRIE